jgi:nitroreductase
MNLLLAATNEGLGAGFFAIGRGETELLAALGVPSGRRPIGVVALGHPSADDAPSPSVSRGRINPARRLHWERWSACAD